MTEVPQAFDRFEVQRILGKGGMGTVVLARDSRLDRLVALRVLHIQDLASDDRRASFMEEARAAASVRHPNVAAVFEVGEREGVPFMVMEHCEGETLAQRIHRRPLEAAEFLNIARQIAAGVAAAHDGGIFHGDLKSSNIILEPSGQAKILDFGLARALHRQIAVSVDSPTGDRFGSLHHLSPEQARGHPADERSDLFSLGALFYQMATGQPPFNAETALLVLQKIRDTEPEPFVPLDSSFPPAAAGIIGRLLRKNRDRRYQNAGELLASLDAVTAPGSGPGTPPSSQRAIGRTVERPRWPRVIVAAAALTVVLLAIYLARGGLGEIVPAAVPPPPPPIRSIAVLPLTSMTASTRNKFLSVAIADALAAGLQRIPSLQVTPMSAVLDLHNPKIDARTVGETLRVEGVLQGRYLAAGDVVRVRLQLIDARSGTSLWDDTTDGRRRDLQKLIDELSAQTVMDLSHKFGVQPVDRGSSPQSSSPRAYEQYLKARALSASGVSAERRPRIAALRRAVALDPDFAAAYADLALESDPEVAERSEWYARQAVRLDPSLPRAHLALGEALARRPDRYRESIHEIVAALRLNPNDPAALARLATAFVSAGDLQKARCIAARVLRLDPDSDLIRTRGNWYLEVIDPDGALQTARFALDSRETELIGHDIKANAGILLGELGAATAEADRAAALAPDQYYGKSLRAMIAAARGDRAACEAALTTFEATANRNPAAAMRQALCYARMGQRARAVAWVSRSAELGSHRWFTWVNHPWLQSIQTDREFQKVIGSMKADVDAAKAEALSVYPSICR